METREPSVGSDPRSRPPAPPAVLVRRATGFAVLVFALGMAAATWSAGRLVHSGANPSLGFFVLAFSLFVTIVIVTAWDRRSQGRRAVWWTLGVIIFNAPAYTLYTVLRRRPQTPPVDGAQPKSLPLWLLALGFAFVAAVSVVILAFPLLIGALLIAALAIARRRAVAGGLLLATAIVVPALAAGHSVGRVKSYRVVNADMQPTLADGDRVITTQNGASYHPRRDEIVAFHPPDSAGGLGGGLEAARCAVNADRYTNTRNGQTLLYGLCPRPSDPMIYVVYVERIVALPGDAVAFRHGHLVLNGAVQREPFTTPCPATNGGCSFRRRIIISPGHYFMLGDNRGISNDDSRWFGPVPRSSILGPVVLRYWPPDRLAKSGLPR